MECPACKSNRVTIGVREAAICKDCGTGFTYVLHGITFANRMVLVTK